MLRSHIADLIEEEGAVLNRFRKTHAACERSAKRSFLVSEEFGFEKLLRDCSAVESQKRNLVGFIKSQMMEFLG